MKTDKLYLRIPVTQIQKTLPVMVAAVLALAGCASMAPPYAAPALPVAAHYPSDVTQDGAAAAAMGWRDYFTDARLQDLIAQALENNRDLRIAVLRVEEARAAYGIQRAEQFPTVAAQAGSERAHVPADLSLTGKPALSSQYQVSLGLASWEIDFWGRVRSLRDAALENYLASDEARRAVTISLVAQVANSYLALCELDERIALARLTIASREESLRIFTRRVEVGSTSRLNLTQVQTLLNQAQALGAQLEQARALQANALTLLAGVTLELPSASGRLDERQMLLPLFDAGRRSNNLSLAEARRDLAVANYEKTIQAAFRDVADALAARQWLAQQLVIAQVALATQTERARLSQLRYDNGAAAYLDVLDAQRDLLVAEQQLVQIRRALLSSQVSLYAALGGGALDVAATDAASTRHTPSADKHLTP